MQQISTTPFGRRAVDAGLLAAQALARGPAPAAPVDKYAVLAALVKARQRFGISDRDLAVLSALVSFLPDRQLADTGGFQGQAHGIVVFPSNRALSERSHGMAESTLRRHIAALVRAGLILRQDSPNGKRYARRDGGGNFGQAFGFDLRPLLVRAPEIEAAAIQADEAAKALKIQRESLVLCLRDATKLLAYAQECLAEGDLAAPLAQAASLARALRRKLSPKDLGDLLPQAQALLAQARKILALNTIAQPHKTEESSGSDGHFGRHQQNSDKDLKESEPAISGVKPNPAAPSPSADPAPAEPGLPLPLVLRATPDILTYAPQGIRTWRDLLAVAAFVYPMLGITGETWRAACQAMGDGAAAVTLACILQRSDQIARPGAYLRSLTHRAQGRGFDPGAMVLALIRAENRHAA